jgi:N-dimethylarginine dimethylaminohydrolase
MALSVLMCSATFFDVREPKNPHMGCAIDHVLAQQQWNNLRQALESAGVTVETIAPIRDLDDMVFTANQVFIGADEKHGRFIVPSQMRHPSRQKEVTHFVRWFEDRGYRTIDLDLKDEYLEGHGDLLWHSDRSRIWAGYGFRSSIGGIERFALAMGKLGFPVTTLELADPFFYHLDTCFCALNEEAVMIYPRDRGEWAIHYSAHHRRPA